MTDQSPASDRRDAEHAGSSAAVRPAIAVVLKGYPRLSETFIAQELRGLERAGFRLVFYSMRFPTDKKRHPIHDEMQATVYYLPEYLHQEPLRVLTALWRARRLAGFRNAFKAWFSDFKRQPTRNRARRFGQALVLATEAREDIVRFYAHFIHTPATVTRYTSLLTGKSWSCSAHAKDIWTSPDWDLAQSLSSADWVATCTHVGAEHLRSIAEADDGSPRTCDRQPAEKAAQSQNANQRGQGKAIGAQKVHLIYHGLDLKRFPSPGAVGSPDGAHAPGPSLTADDAHQRDGSTPARAVRILSVGRAVPKKGFDLLLTALADLPSEMHWQFTHIGGGGELATLKSHADILGISDRITWKGAQAQEAVLEAYRASDMFVLPCRVADDGDRDGLPNVLVEAQSQRLVCVSTKVSAIPELIRDGETGRLVESEDAGGLSAAIAELIGDPGKRLQLAAAGETRVRAEFDMGRGLDQLAALFPADLRALPPQSDAGTAGEDRASQHIAAAE